MNQHLAGKRHADAVAACFRGLVYGLAADRYDMGIIKLVSRYDKCLNFESDYMEILEKVCATTCIFVFFPIINTYFLIAKCSLLSGYPTYKFKKYCKSRIMYEYKSFLRHLECFKTVGTCHATRVAKPPGNPLEGNASSSAYVIAATYRNVV
jgi:hypothetical protein